MLDGPMPAKVLGSVLHHHLDVAPFRGPLDPALGAADWRAGLPDVDENLFVTMRADRLDDLDGDGAYEIILHQAGKGHDNSHNGITDPPIFQAYTLSGEFLWQINLGKNIREGAHYTQFMVYDLDGDG